MGLVPFLGINLALTVARGLLLWCGLLLPCGETLSTLEVTVLGNLTPHFTPPPLGRPTFVWLGLDVRFNSLPFVSTGLACQENREALVRSTFPSFPMSPRRSLETMESYLKTKVLH